MFDQTFVNLQNEARKPWSIAASLAAQCGVVAVLLLIPLMHPELLQLKIDVPIFVPLHPMTELPKVIEVARASHKASISHVFTAPRSIPNRIVTAPGEIAMPDAGVSFADVGPVTPGIPGGIPGLSSTVLPGYTPPPPPVMKRPEAAKPAAIHVGGDVQAARLVFKPTPAYPSLAKTARVQGTVKIEAIIGPDGAIRNLSVRSGPPLLISAAMEAVRQWRYAPTLLNGQPVEVITEIDVNFTLNP